MARLNIYISESLHMDLRTHPGEINVSKVRDTCRWGTLPPKSPGVNARASCMR